MPEWLNDPYIVLGTGFGLIAMLLLAAKMFGFEQVTGAIARLLDRFGIRGK